MARNIYSVTPDSGQTEQQYINKALSQPFAFGASLERVVVVDMLTKEVTVVNGTIQGKSTIRQES